MRFLVRDAHPTTINWGLIIASCLKSRTSRMLQMEYPELNKRYWGRHFWAIGYGGWSTGNITEEMVQEYLEHHRKPSDNENMILE